MKGLRPILLVEDNVDDIDLTVRSMEKAGIENKLITCKTGRDAITYLLDDTHELPLLIILDLNLPIITGHEVLRMIRENDKTRLIPVVILTTSKEESDLRLSYELGANSYIQKPVDYLQFRDMVKKLGDYWLTLNEYPPVSGRGGFDE